MKNIHQTFQTECFLIKLMLKTDVLHGIVFLVSTCIQYAIPLISVWLWKLILDELTIISQTQTANNLVWFFLGIYLVLQILSSIITHTNSFFYDTIKRKASINLDVAVMKKMASLDASFFDDPDNSNILIAAQTSEIYITDNMLWVIETIIRGIAFIASLIMFLSYDWIIGILFIFTYIPGSIISFKHKEAVDQWSINNIPESRKKNYYKSLLTDSFAAKDLRLYNLSGEFQAKYNELWNRIRAKREELFVKTSITSFLASLLTYSGLVVIILFSVDSVLFGDMAIGTFAFYIGLAQTAGNNFRFLVGDIACQVKIIVPHVILYKSFLKYENEIEDNGKEAIAKYPSIEFRDVCFKYPGNREYTLRNLSFKIESNKKIAIVGVNGAGKSTIIKLLLRFYDPESGEILLDGKNIKSYPLNELRKLFSVCFQNVNCYSLTLRENIAISDINRKHESDSIKMAATAAGADNIINELTDKLDTDMTKQFNDKGANLSGGQWQKVALARAFFRNSQYIILDEPSSALDPEAEDYIFSSFKQLCKDKAGILISHRLSNIMLVDEIVFLDNGTVTESGTHAELIKINGKYAELYKMQSKKYTGGNNKIE